MTVPAIPPLLFERANNAVRSLAMAPYAFGRRERVREIWSGHCREVLAVAVLSPLAYVLVLFAMRLAPVSPVAPAGNSASSSPAWPHGGCSVPAWCSARLEPIR